MSPAAFAEIGNPDNAQVSGRRLEKQIENGLRDLGLEIIEIKNWKEARLYEEPNLTAVIKNVPYKSIYGHRARMEFLLLNMGKQYLIEVKRQRSKGSTDEKLPYVFSNALENLKIGRQYILIMDGDGWKSGAVDWINNKAKLTDGFYVMSPNEFLEWIGTNTL